LGDFAHVCDLISDRSDFIKCELETPPGILVVSQLGFDVPPHVVDKQQRWELIKV
jgi:hypothetical protein